MTKKKESDTKKARTPKMKTKLEANLLSVDVILGLSPQAENLLHGLRLDLCDIAAQIHKVTMQLERIFETIEPTPLCPACTKGDNCKGEQICGGHVLTCGSYEPSGEGTSPPGS